MGLFAWLRRLFGGRTPPARPPATVAEPEPIVFVEPEPESPEPEPEPAPPPVAEDPATEDTDAEDERDDDLWEDEDDAADGPDPFITGAVLSEGPSPEEVVALRAQARDQALAGEHRIPLSSPAGPGSLSEALNLLLDEGLVEAQFIEDDEAGPLIRYRPVEA